MLRLKRVLAVLAALVVAAVFFFALTRFRQMPPGPEASESVAEPATAGVPPVETGADDLIDGTLEDPIAMLPEDFREQAAARERVPPRMSHLALIEQIESETIEETAENIGSLDEIMPVIGGITGTGGRGDPQRWSLGILAMTRVKRLLEAGLKDPAAVAPVLRGFLEESVAEWPAVYARVIRNMPYRVEEDGDPWTYIPWRTCAAAYVLAETGDVDSLPLMRDVIRLYRPSPTGLMVDEVRTPVAPGFIFAAMHKLVVAYPQNRLSVEAAALRDDYLRAARELLPDEYPKEKGTSWRGRYIDSDPRLVLFDPEGKALKGEPMTEFTLFPWTYLDGEPLNTERSYLTERTEYLLGKMEAFIEAAYSSGP